MKYMYKEVEMDFGTVYVVPLADGRKIFVTREVKNEEENGRPGINMCLVDNTGNVYDLALAKVEPKRKEEIIHLSLYGDVFSEDPTDERSINREDLEYIEEHDG